MSNDVVLIVVIWGLIFAFFKYLSRERPPITLNLDIHLGDDDDEGPPLFGGPDDDPLADYIDLPDLSEWGVDLKRPSPFGTPDEDSGVFRQFIENDLNMGDEDHGERS
jgi:hypothetical protein